MPPYKVLIQPSGREFSVVPGRSVLESALDAGITLPYGCKDGACGSCKGRVISGRLEQGPHAPAALSAAEEAAGLALFCCAHAQSDLVIEARLPSALDGIVVRKMPARVERIAYPAPDVAMLWLKLPASEQMYFRAGQYVDVILAGGERRSYSIASPPHTDGPLELHIRHLPGGLFTDALFGARPPVIQERGILRIEGPLGTFHLHEDDTGPIVLLASGTGFAPIKAIAETIFAKGINRDTPNSGRRARSVALYWGARTQADLYLDALPRLWAAEQPNFHYVPVLSEATPPDGNPQGIWGGRRGLVHQAVMADLPDLSAHQVYACGAPPMVEAARRDFTARCHLPAERFFADAFLSRADLGARAGAQDNG